MRISLTLVRTCMIHFFVSANRAHTKKNDCCIQKKRVQLIKSVSIHCVCQYSILNIKTIPLVMCVCVVGAQLFVACAVWIYIVCEEKKTNINFPSCTFVQQHTTNFRIVHAFQPYIKPKATIIISEPKWNEIKKQNAKNKWYKYILLYFISWHPFTVHISEFWC